MVNVGPALHQHVHQHAAPAAAPVTINIFGEENTEHITPETLGHILDSFPEGAPDGQRVIVTVVRHIYGDPRHPENLTCYTPNQKKDLVLVRGEAGWESRTSGEVFPAMLARACTELNDKQDYYAEPGLLDERSKQVKAAFNYETSCGFGPANHRPSLEKSARVRAELTRKLQTITASNKTHLSQLLGPTTLNRMPIE